MKYKLLVMALILSLASVTVLVFFYHDKNEKCEKQNIGGVFEVGEICR